MKEEDLILGYANLRPLTRPEVSITIGRKQTITVLRYLLWYLVRHPRTPYIKISLSDD